MKIYGRIAFLVYGILLINPAVNAVQNVAVDAPQKGVDTSWPVVTVAIAVNQDARITLRLKQKPVAKLSCVARLTVLSNGKSREFKTELSPNGLVLIPARILQAAYNDGTKSFLTRPAELRVKPTTGPAVIIRLCLYDSTAKPEFKNGKVKSVNGQPYFFINDQRVPRMNGRLAWFKRFAAGKADRPYFIGRNNRQFAEAGMHWNIVQVYPFKYMSVRNSKIVFDRKAFLQELYKIATLTVAEDPEAVIYIYWHLTMPAECQKLKPEEMIKLDNGKQMFNEHLAKKSLQPSYASEYWRELAGRFLRETIEEIRRSPWADRVGAFRFNYGNGGEWNHWGYHEKALVDFSKPMNRAFGKWLRKKYKTDAALKKAWGKSSVTFNSADLIPTRKERLIGKGPFRLGGTAVQSSVDYYKFFQKYTAKTIEHFAKITKQASGGKLLTGCYYGYYWGHMADSPYHSQDSGHYGLKYINQSPWIDFVGGPSTYYKRKVNSVLHGVSNSLALHGKVWEAELDTRTHHSTGRRQYGITDSLSESLAIIRRDYGITRAGQAIAYYFDFVADWYKDTEFLDTFARLRRIDDFLLTQKDRFPREVAVIISEEVIPHLSSISMGRKGALVALQEHMLFELNRIGIPFDMYLESDLKTLNPDKYKYYIFINSFYVSDETMSLIHNKIMKNKRKVLFYYAPGVISETNKYDFKRSKKLTGIGIKLVPGGSSDTVFLLPDKKVKTSGKNDTSPQFCISDPSAKVFAVFADGKPAGAMRKTADYTSIVLCNPAPNYLFLRKWLTSLGARCYQYKGDAFCYFTGSLMTVYSNKGGAASIRLPKDTEIVADFMTDETIRPNPRRINVHTNGRMFYVGTMEDWFKFSNPRVKRYYSPESMNK